MATTHEERLKELATSRHGEWHDACLAGAEALRLLREYQDAFKAFDAVPDDEDGTAEWERFRATSAALLATEVTR